MREILFRGKRTDNSEWAYGDIVHIEDRFFVSYYNNCELRQFINDEVTSNNITLVGVFPFVEVIPESVGQYTGLIDKNGNKIFEGDIISASYESPLFDGYHNATFTHIGAVRYNPNICTLIVDNKKQGFCLGELNDYEVVSNIHDNPELLEVG